MIAPALRRTLIFTTVAGLGLTLAWLLAGRDGVRRGPGPRLAVVDVPAGTHLQGPRGIPGILLVEAEGVRVAPVEEIQLDDGSRVPFRALVLRSDSERPLPSTAPGVRRAALVRPHLRMVPVPRTREALAAGAVPTTLSAPEGILESGPGDRLRLELRGGVEVDSVRRGTPWSFRAEQAASDLQARTVRAPGPVSVSSPELVAEGRDLEVKDEGRVLVLAGGASGTARDAGGVRFAGGSPRGDTRFRCTGPLRIEEVPPAPGSGARPDRHVLVLEGDARVEQDAGSLAADRIRADLRRRAGADAADFEEVRADGRVVLEARGDAGDLRATGGRLVARPLKDGGTEAFLEERPTVAARETRPDGAPRQYDVAGDGTARIAFPEKSGPVEALFRGGATAVATDPAGPGETDPRRREVRAKTLSLDALRSEKGDSKVRGVAAVGDASFVEGERRARADRITWTPREDGGSRLVLEGAVTGAWPAAGVLDPLSGPRGEGAAPPAEAGSLLLSTQGRAVLDLPPEGAADAPASFVLEGAGPGGGSVVRRVAGEREVWRLSCRKCEGTLRPGDRSLDALVASGAVTLAGREERPGGRTYDLRGESLEVRGEPGSGRPLSAELRGVPGALPSVTLAGPDGRPLTVAGEVLRLDRTDGSLRADGSVRASGVLPEGPASPLPSAGGRVEFACKRLDARFVEGEAAGTSRLVSLVGRGAVWVKTATEFASGDLLLHDAERGTVELRGDPARVTSRPGAKAGGDALESRCEAPALLLSFRGGSLQEARAPEGGLLVHHRPAEDAAPGAAPRPAERVEARANGALVYSPAETVLTREVTLEVSVHRDGRFRLRDRMEGADEVRILHPATAPGAAGRFERAVASSRLGRIAMESREGGWRATGLSLAEHDAAAERVVLEAGPGIPRFRIEGRDGAATARRVVYDYRAGTLGEWMGLGGETGK